MSAAASRRWRSGNGGAARARVRRESRYVASDQEPGPHRHDDSSESDAASGGGDGRLRRHRLQLGVVAQFRVVPQRPQHERRLRPAWHVGRHRLRQPHQLQQPAGHIHLLHLGHRPEQLRLRQLARHPRRVPVNPTDPGAATAADQFQHSTGADSTAVRHGQLLRLLQRRHVVALRQASDRELRQLPGGRQRLQHQRLLQPADEQHQPGLRGRCGEIGVGEERG